MKDEKLRLIVVLSTITMIIVLFIGITYSYFTALNNQGSTSVISATSGKMAINYADGSSKLLSSEDIVPSDKILIDKTFTLTGTNTTSGLAMPYKVGLNYISEFSDGQIHYYIKRTSTNANITSTLVGTANQVIPGNTTETGYTTGTLKKGNRYIELATGEFKANTSNQTITFNLKMQFPDTGVSQDSEKGKSLTGEIVVNYEEEPETIAETLAKLDKEANGLEIDDTDDQNLRYVGSTPNNYISFNDETWRIIGIFNVYNNDTKKNEKLVKIIRNDSLGSYSWDTSDSSINSGWGINEWSQADLMTELNTDYLDTSKTSGTTTWYNGQNNAKSGSYDYSKNIKSGYIDKIANVRWNLGGSNSYSNSVKTFYTLERGTTHISNPSDGIARTNTWDGKIALMYPSDYGYASTDTNCRNNLASYNSSNEYNAYCMENNWLFNSAFQWTLSPYSSLAHNVFRVRSDGFVYSYDAYYAYGVRPVLFLKSDILIAGGEGTQTNPYNIG